MIENPKTKSNLYLGKFRALVTDIEDPEKRGRIKVRCPKIYGDYESPWCLPFTSFALDYGGWFKVPAEKEMVWIEFEEGDPDFPILVGGLWQKDKVPKTAKGDEVYDEEIDKHVIIKTELGHIIDISDYDDNKFIIITTSEGHIIEMSDNAGDRFINIEDAEGNYMKFDTENNDILITANRDIIISAGRNIHRNAGVHISDDAPRIDHN